MRLDVPYIVGGRIHSFILADLQAFSCRRQLFGIDTMVLHSQMTSCQVVPNAQPPLTVLECVLDWFGS